MRAVANKVRRKIRQALVLALTHPAAILATHVAPIDDTRPISDIHMGLCAPTKQTLNKVQYRSSRCTESVHFAASIFGVRFAFTLKGPYGDGG